MLTEPENLKKKIIEFVKAQQGYDQMKHEKLNIIFEDREDHLVILGIGLLAGMSGMGSSLNSAYLDFVKKWKDLNGFEWIEKNHLTMNH